MLLSARVISLRRAGTKKALITQDLNGGGGGSRTRVPRAFLRGIYMLSVQFIVVAESPKCELFSFQAS